MKNEKLMKIFAVAKIHPNYSIFIIHKSIILFLAFEYILMNINESGVFIWRIGPKLSLQGA